MAMASMLSWTRCVLTAPFWAVNVPLDAGFVTMPGSTQQTVLLLGMDGLICLNADGLLNMGMVNPLPTTAAPAVVLDNSRNFRRLSLFVIKSPLKRETFYCAIRVSRLRVLFFDRVDCQSYSNNIYKQKHLCIFTAAYPQYRYRYSFYDVAEMFFENLENRRCFATVWKKIPAIERSIVESIS